jgi:NTP pyrophosphatase (non-canonical NTP hydrolase)
MKASYEQLEHAVVGWATQRMIIQNGTATSQLLKAVAEMGELADAFNKGDRAGVVDGLGDVLVCLINFAEIERLSLVECLESAYNEIKDRRGTLMPNGVFVKEEAK